MAADGGSERDVVHNESGLYSLGSAENVPSHRGLGIKAKKCLCEGVIVLTACTEQKHGV